MKKTSMKFSTKSEQKKYIFVENSEIGPDSETLTVVILENQWP